MADLSLNPDYVYEDTPVYDTLVSRFENGVEQRRSRRASAIREFRLEYKNRSSSDFTTISNLFAEKKGQLTTFSWTNPVDSTAYTVRFKEDSLSFQLKAYQVYDFAFNLVQVL